MCSFKGTIRAIIKDGPKIINSTLNSKTPERVLENAGALKALLTRSSKNLKMLEAVYTFNVLNACFQENLTCGAIRPVLFWAPIKRRPGGASWLGRGGLVRKRLRGSGCRCAGLLNAVGNDGSYLSKNFESVSVQFFRLGG